MMLPTFPQERGVFATQTAEDDPRLDADELFNMFPKGVDVLIMKLVRPDISEALTIDEVRLLLQGLKSIGHRQ